MSYEFKFSIVMAVYNIEEYLHKSINSVINQSIGFEENVQLVLVNDGSIDNSLEILENFRKKYPKNILVISQENNGQADARNNGLKYVKGKYVNFLDGDDYLSINALEEVYRFFENNYNKTDIVAIPIKFFGRREGAHILNKKFEKSRIIDLVKEPNNPQLSSSSAFFKKELFEKYNFPTNVLFSEDSILINKILLEKKTLGVLNTAEYFYRRRFDYSSTIDLVSLKKEYYIDKLRDYFIYLINYTKSSESEIPNFILYLISYELQWIFEQSDLTILDDNEKNEFFKYLDEIVKIIPRYFILNNHYINDVYTKYYFLFFKEKDLHIEKDSNNNVLLKIKDFTCDNLNNHKIWFDIVDINDDYLILSGLFNSLFNREYISIEAIKEDEDGTINHFLAKQVNYTARKDICFFNQLFQYKNNFDLKIPLKGFEKSTIKIKLNFHIDKDINNFSSENIVSSFLRIDFQNHAKFSKLSNYKFNDTNILYFENNLFTLIPFSYKNLLKRELSSLRKIWNKKPEGYRNALFLRLLNLSSYPFLKRYFKNKEIYLFEDRIEVSDDNASHLFKYALTFEDNVEKYIVMDKDCPQYSEFSKMGKVVIFNSFKHKILLFYTDKILTSHPYDETINPFYLKNNDERPLYGGLLSFKTYFLQHGVTIGNISSWLSKFDINLSLVNTVSDLERDSFLDDGYNYDESIIQTLGFPRFDNLENKSKKQVLIIPSWRRYLRGNKENFINSKYFRDLNSLLNNEKLIKLLTENGYKIIFKQHPELTKFINESEERYVDLFNKPDEIIFSENESYEDLFNSSSLMITDFSSVFFDFAYLKKPVIYYQTDDDYHYKKSYFNFETMGFGDIIHNEEDLIKKIQFYLENNCLMEDEYIRRVEKFFKFNDKNNCERVYNWIKKN